MPGLTVRDVACLVRCGCSHAGFSYSAPTAAFAYKHVNPASISRVFILGPSHHHHTKQCQLTRHAYYATPIGDMAVDAQTVRELRERGDSRLFDVMSERVDEDEHSIEMHLPFVHFVLGGGTYTIVPILVGTLSSQLERELAVLLTPYFLAPGTLFVVSSDFCHWGRRFGYQPTSPPLPIHRAIQQMDEAGMAVVEAGGSDAWRDYIKRTDNTVCGRHPIGLLLAVREEAGKKGVGLGVRWVRYAQSSAVVEMSDSSVSYASAVVYLTGGEGGGSADGKAEGKSEL